MVLLPGNSSRVITIFILISSYAYQSLSSPLPSPSPSTSAAFPSPALIVKSRLARSPFSSFESERAGGPSPAMTDGHLKFVPLKDFIDRAKGDPLLLGIISRALQRVGFDGQEVNQLLSRGKATYKGSHVSIDDVSKFCCPLGV